MCCSAKQNGLYTSEIKLASALGTVKLITNFILETLQWYGYGSKGNSIHGVFISGGGLVCWVVLPGVTVMNLFMNSWIILLTTSGKTVFVKTYVKNFRETCEDSCGDF